MNADYKYLRELETLAPRLAQGRHPYEYPLDTDVMNILLKIKEKIHMDDDSEYEIFQSNEDIKELWGKLVEKSIQCLRYYDKREPFKGNQNKRPLAYGLSNLKKYFDKYIGFENVMYGGVKYYRDHVIHVFRVWLLGMVILLRNNGVLLDKIYIDDHCSVNKYEKISIWTLIALTHDLGYPLEKASQIIESTQDMLKAFVSNPILSMDLSFNGVQNSMNDFILRLVSSKMELRNNNGVRNKYVARLQPKYYFKFQKSLEHNKHGILSAIIICKLLLYFLESDFSVNEDYLFDKEEIRQFYIRRDILRSIASHTCSDVYQMNQFLFSYLLIICDDTQSWGRKDISELYIDKDTKYRFGDISIDIENGSWEISDSYIVKKETDAKSILSAFQRQCINYVTIFRDGQDTIKRNFNFKWLMTLSIAGATNRATNYIVTFNAVKDERIKVSIARDRRDALSNKNTIVREFDNIFGYKNDATNGNTIHECDFTRSAI